MEIKQTKITLPEGTFTVGLQYFEEQDREKLFGIYHNWRLLCDRLKDINSRSVNLPEGLSEGAFSLEMHCPRMLQTIPSANTSFDCFDPIKNERIQVKACSILPDLTSFGPKSVWDKLYFCDFYKDGSWTGTFDIYLIPNEFIYSHHVNQSQTLKEQQIQGRRPRFSIYSDIILKHSLQPIKTGTLI